MDELAAFLEEISYEPSREHLEWIQSPIVNPSNEELDTECLSNWVCVGELNYSIATETSFCDAALLKEYLNLHSKSKGTKAGLFDWKNKSIFNTRSGFKAANIDALVNFTEPTKPTGEPLVPIGHHLNYLDLTNGTEFTHGFTEYMRWRKGKLARSCALGQITERSHKNTSKIRECVQFVRNRLEKGVHLVFSDGIDLDRSNFECSAQVMEVCHGRYFMCKSILALGTLAENGTFILKFHNMYTPFMVGLLYLIYLHFREMAILKPFTSRPYRAERYAVFRSRNARDCTQLQDHLLRLNDEWQDMKTMSVVQLVPLKILQADRTFYEYIVSTNNCLARCIISQLNQNYGWTDDDNQRRIRVQEICSRVWKIDEFERNGLQRDRDDWRMQRKPSERPNGRNDRPLIYRNPNKTVHI